MSGTILGPDLTPLAGVSVRADEEATTYFNTTGADGRFAIGFHLYGSPRTDMIHVRTDANTTVAASPLLEFPVEVVWDASETTLDVSSATLTYGEPTSVTVTVAPGMEPSPPPRPAPSRSSTRIASSPSAPSAPAEQSPSITCSFIPTRRR